ncbi:acyl-CoA N-acyltransferase [Lasiosphaeria hispida]|uniref:Acyl-CoA N-acyltransferase n=1 Tax=Lasiosphaeria hispida TaxID=260671 RepID=A0AAJ0HBA5_9PEZI|nr:acyl-CoA N-acyltransferase [Lasiosphaeria hispida]
MVSPSRRIADFAASADTFLKLPYPYQTAYRIAKGDNRSFQLRQIDIDASALIDGSNTKPLPAPLHSTSLFFTEPQDLKSSDRPHESNNTQWGRARRSPAVIASWKDAHPPTVGQLWLIAYAIFTVRPTDEAFRLELDGAGAEQLAQQLQNVNLAIPHPVNTAALAAGPLRELLVLRGAFWQGAGCPFGARPVWVPEAQDPDPAAFPAAAAEFTTTQDPASALCWHPRRRAKPMPGSVLYSRYVPHLRETFSMTALDHTSAEHVALFHAWQNDPRVSQGWDKAGTLEQHRQYLQKAHEDPHQITILAQFDEVHFAYFEVYWAKEDAIGAYYSAGNFDRGRHSLVGDVRFRGPHRVSAWWSSLMHYLYLDEPRTVSVVGEPKYTNSSVLMYDLMHGFGLDKFIDLPDKRAAFVRCSRERFFQLCPLDDNDKVMGGTNVGLVPKL